jgi:uncharacterized protein DUF2752
VGCDVASVGDERRCAVHAECRGMGDCGCGHNEKVAIPTDVRRFSAARAAGYVGAFFAGGLALSALYTTTGVGLPCPFRALTGWDCPLCGGTRMGATLLHGDVSDAFMLNPLALIGLVILGVLGSLWAVEAAGGPAVRLPRPLAERLRRVRLTQWLVLGLVVAVTYTLARNLL